jgi:hypothetical protein
MSNGGSGDKADDQTLSHAAASREQQQHCCWQSLGEGRLKIGHRQLLDSAY